MKIFLCIFFSFLAVNSVATDFFEDLNAPLIPIVSTPPLPFDKPPRNYQLRQNYDYIDSTHLIGRTLQLQRALKFYEFNISKINNLKYLTLIDFSQHESIRRLFLIDMTSGRVTTMHTAVGKGSDPDNDGYANTFSNIPDSHKSSLGFYLTGEEYIGGNGRSLQLHGLSDTNSNALARFIVIHGASYVSEVNNHAGRSFGCPAVDPKNLDALVDSIKIGSLLYIYK